LLLVGQFSTSKYGPLSITDENLSNAVSNYNADVPKSVPINLDHLYGEAAGWFQGFIHQEGVGLFGVVDWTKLGKEKLMDRLYRFFSAEFDYDYEDPQDREALRLHHHRGALT
jgi:hypothetical protein